MILVVLVCVGTQTKDFFKKYLQLSQEEDSGTKSFDMRYINIAELLILFDIRVTLKPVVLSICFNCYYLL